MVYGQSDDFGESVAENEVHVHDFHATILHLLGLDHERLTYRHAGRDYRLTDVHGRVVKDILAPHQNNECRLLHWRMTVLPLFEWWDCRPLESGWP